MAITLANTSATDSSSATNLTITENASASSGDLMLVFCMRASNTDDGEWVDPADFTQIALKHETLGNTDGQIYLGYKKRGSDAGNGYLFDFGGTASPMAAVMLRFSGVDPTTQLDVTYVDATHYNSNSNAVTTAARAITTVTNNALVVLLQNFTQDIDTAGPPSGYAEVYSGPSAITTTSGKHLYIATKTVAVAGAETPGAWTHTDVTDVDADGRNFTIALRPGTVPVFDTTPTVSSVTSTDYTIGYEASVDATNVYLGAYPLGAATPTGAQVKAGTGAHGTATEATTGAPDTIVLTPSDATKFPAYDIYLVLESGSGFSAVAALLGSYLTATSGFEFTVIDVPWGASEQSVLENASPAAVDGDIIRSSTLTSPGSYTVNMAADGVFSFDPGIDSGRQTITAHFYDVSVQAYSDASPVTFYVNNVAPVYASPDSDFLYEKSVAITGLALEPLWSDMEGDALTVTFQDTLPTGLSNAAETLVGTPTVYGSTVVTMRAQDVTAEYTEHDITIDIGPRLPNVVNSAEAAAIATIQAIASLTATVTSRESSGTIVLGNVISMDPISNTLVKPTEAVSLIVSLGDTAAAVPNIVGLSQPAAKVQIAAVGLVVGTITYTVNPANLYLITAQSPTAGEQISAGSAVSYTVGVLGTVVKGHGRRRH